ncbi:MAG TPA: tetratricopeptide repeat protein [Rhodanobacteraceae bacterium]|nr:tetratricopeptide repeat protein [Rhodanobacteraceae bacterium]
MSIPSTTRAQVAKRSSFRAILEIVRMELAKFKLKGSPGVVSIVLSGVLSLAGCASGPSHTAARAKQPLATLQLPEQPAQDAAALTLAAEFALQRDDIKTAAADYANAAALSSDPEVAQRALELNLAMQNEQAVPALIARWQVLGAKPRELAGARAQLAMLEGNRDEAEKQFAILLSSRNPGDWRAFGSALMQARDTALAGVLLETLAPPSKLPADEKLWVAFSQLGDKLGRHAYAQRLADAAAKRFGGESSLLWAAQMKIAAGDHAGAKALFARALEAHRDNTMLRLAYAALLARDGDVAGAERVLAQGKQDAQTWTARVAYAARAKDNKLLGRLYAQLKQAPEDVRDQSVFLLGQLAELLGKNKQALAWYDQVPGDDEHAFEAQARSAVLMDKAGQHEQAHQLARQMQQDYADNSDHLRAAFQLDAELYASNGDDPQAIAAYSRGLHALPGDTELLYGRALSEADGNRTEAAVADLRRLLTLKPDDVEAMNALGYTLADSGQHLDEATQLLRKALAAKPDEPAIIDSWGWLQYRLGHLDEAEKALRRAWEKGKDADIGVHLGEVLWKRGHKAEANSVFAQVRKLDPDNKGLRATLQRLQP